MSTVAPRSGINDVIPRRTDRRVASAAPWWCRNAKLYRFCRSTSRLADPPRASASQRSLSRTSPPPEGHRPVPDRRLVGLTTKPADWIKTRSGCAHCAGSRGPATSLLSVAVERMTSSNRKDGKRGSAEPGCKPPPSRRDAFY